MKKLYLMVLVGVSPCVAGIMPYLHLFGPDMIEQPIVLQVPEADGSIITRRGELVIRPGARATVILAHGFKHDKSHSKALRVLFPHYNTLVFDFRGHGENIVGQCCSFGGHEVADLKAAGDFIRSHPDIGHLPLFAYGMSMGAATCIETQARHDLFDGLVLDSPFESMEDVVTRGLNRIKYVLFGYDVLGPVRRLFERNMYHPYINKLLRFILRNCAGMDSAEVVTCLRPVCPVESIKQVSVPTLLIGCNQDTLTPPEGIKKIHSGVAHRNTQLWLIDGKGHVGAFFAHPEVYIKKVNDFMSKVIKRRQRKYRL